MLEISRKVTEVAHITDNMEGVLGVFHSCKDVITHRATTNSKTV